MAVQTPADFERADRAFRAAAAVDGTAERWYAVGGLGIALRFAGPALLPAVTPALEHLVVEPTAPPTLRVDLWDTASTGVPVPPRGVPPARPAAGGHETGPGLQVAYQPDPCSLSLLLLEQGRALHWVPDGRGVPLSERAAPLRHLFYRWLRYNGRHLVHGAAVGTSAGSVLLAGRGGAGKSTSALACVLAGLDYLGDDYVGLIVDPVPTAFSVYNSAKLHRQQVAALPGLPPVDNPDGPAGDKGVWFVHRHFPARCRSSLPIKAELVPAIDGGRTTRVAPLSAAAALLALAPTTVFVLAGASDEAFGAMARLLRQVPCYRLMLGCDLAAIAPAVVDLLARS